MTIRPRLLDLFCGAGGAAMGYYRAGFEVVGVDIKSQPHYPFEFHLADALTYPLEGFAVVHASPPCQKYSKCTPMRYRASHPNLIPAVRERLKGKVYIIENVEGARKKLLHPIMLCGSMFGLPIHRHRYFEIFPRIPSLIPLCRRINGPTIYISGTPRPRDGSRRMDPPAAVKRLALGTPWMVIKDMDQAIPPAYTEFIGRQIYDTLNRP
jgi:DNA (cytosine-5)-methyltransferase 1